MDNSINGLKTSGLEGLGLNKTEVAKSKELGQEDFLKLMTAQLTHQDPTKPLDNAEFLSQLAQFGTVEGITELQTSFNSLNSSLQSNQALQASTLVGRSVLVPGDSTNFKTGDVIEGEVDLTTSTDQLNIMVTNSSGQLVKELNLGPQQQGDVPFKWDGLDDSGIAAPNGHYNIVAESTFAGEISVMQTKLAAKVDSVTLAGTGPVLNLAGLGSISIDEVKQVR